MIQMFKCYSVSESTERRDYADFKTFYTWVNHTFSYFFHLTLLSLIFPPRVPLSSSISFLLFISLSLFPSLWLHQDSMELPQRQKDQHKFLKGQKWYDQETEDYLRYICKCRIRHLSKRPCWTQINRDCGDHSPRAVTSWKVSVKWALESITDTKLGDVTI